MSKFIKSLPELAQGPAEFSNSCMPSDLVDSAAHLIRARPILMQIGSRLVNCQHDQYDNHAASQNVQILFPAAAANHHSYAIWVLWLLHIFCFTTNFTPFFVRSFLVLRFLLILLFLLSLFICFSPLCRRPWDFDVPTLTKSSVDHFENNQRHWSLKANRFQCFHLLSK